MTDVTLYRSMSHNPYENLALEQSLFHHKQEKTVLFLWRNDPCVVIGRNQNPYQECKLDYMKENQILLARRTTGGGAVYQDLGNLNFTVIMNHQGEEEAVKMVQKVLHKLGFDTKRSGRNDLLIGDRKFSGMAYTSDDGRYMYHGTMLVSVSTEKLTSCLRPSIAKLKSKGVASVASRVVNLNEIDPSITVERILTQFDKEYPNGQNIDPGSWNCQRQAQKGASVNWLYGESPTASFCLPYGKREGSGQGNYEIWFDVIDDQMKHVSIYSDSLETKQCRRIEEIAEGFILNGENPEKLVEQWFDLVYNN